MVTEDSYCFKINAEKMISESVNVKAASQPLKKFVQSTKVDVTKVISNGKDANTGLRIPGSNWQKFKNLVTEVTTSEPDSNSNPIVKKKRKRYRKNITKDIENQSQASEVVQQEAKSEPKEHEKVKPHTGLTRVIAMDCEMVGIGMDGQDSMIARISIVNRNGACVYDKYVKPTEEVKDYRTAVSGIRPHHLKDGCDFKTVQQEVSEILKGRILVGHALHNDLDVLFLSHPKRLQRDTSRYKLFRKVTKGNTPSLKKLALELLGVNIQSGEHNSIEDARAAMQLYMLFRKKWETDLRTKR